MEKPTQEFLQLSQYVGYIILNWALVERQFDNWVSVAFKQCKGKILRKNQDIPQSFKEKKKFLSDCFRKLPILKEFKEPGLDLLTRAFPVSQTRNDLVHGTIESIYPTNGAFHFHIVKAAGTHHTVREFEFALSDFPAIERALAGLVKETLVMSNRLSSTFLK